MKYYVKVALQHLAMGLIIPISIVWKLQNGLSLTEALLTEAIVLFVTALVDLPAGVVASKLTNKAALLIGGALHVLGVILLALGSSFWVFVAAAIATGAAWAFVSGADEAYIHDDYIGDKAEYKKVFATSTIVDEISTIVGMLAASLIIYLGANIRMLFVVASVILAVHVLYTLAFLPRGQQLPLTHPKEAVMSLGNHKLFFKKFRLVLFAMVAFAVVYEAGRPLWQPHMQELGIDIASFGIIFALLKCASLAGSVLARYRPFHRRDLNVIFCIMLVSLAVFGIDNKVVSLAALCLFLVTENYFRVYMSTILNGLITSNRAAVLSLGSVIRNIAGAALIVTAGAFSSVSIFYGLLALVIVKIPAVIYILRLDKILSSRSTST